MRENRYEDIRKDVVNRTGTETKKNPEMKNAAPVREAEKEFASQGKKEQTGNYEEYNSWS